MASDFCNFIDRKLRRIKTALLIKGTVQLSESGSSVMFNIQCRYRLSLGLCTELSILIKSSMQRYCANVF